MNYPSPPNQILIYTGDNGQPVIDVQTDGETVWLTTVQTEGNWKVSRNIEHYPRYLSRKQSIFQKIAKFVEEFKGVGGQYRDDEISRGTLILRQTARFHISRAGRFRNILCDSCRYSAGFNGIPKQNDRLFLAEMAEGGRHADH